MMRPGSKREREWLRSGGLRSQRCESGFVLRVLPDPGSGPRPVLTGSYRPLLAHVPLAVVAEIRTARRIERAVSLRAISDPIRVAPLRNGIWRRRRGGIDGPLGGGDRAAEERARRKAGDAGCDAIAAAIGTAVI